MLTSNDVIESIEFQPKQNDKSVPMDVSSIYKWQMESVY